jgi:hypothetical protein
MLNFTHKRCLYLTMVSRSLYTDSNFNGIIIYHPYPLYIRHQSLQRPEMRQIVHTFCNASQHSSKDTTERWVSVLKSCGFRFCLYTDWTRSRRSGRRRSTCRYAFSPCIAALPQALFQPLANYWPRPIFKSGRLMYSLHWTQCPETSTQFPRDRSWYALHGPTMHRYEYTNVIFVNLYLSIWTWLR